jgi:PTS system mannose-specific IIB component
MDKDKLWVRVDNRLVHGQVIENWLPYSDARTLLVVNDEVAADELHQEIMRLAIPRGIGLFFSSVSDVVSSVEHCEENRPDVQIFLLFMNCGDVRRAYEHGLRFNILNVGNLHYGPGKRQVCDHIALSQQDIECLKFFSARGVALDFRCVPNKSVSVRAVWLELLQ